MKYFLLGLLLFLIFPAKSFAAFNFYISNISLTNFTSGSQEVDVSLNINDLPSESYFRVAAQKASGGSYLGYVKNNSGEWALIKALNEDCSGYYRISDLSTTSLILKFKLGDDIVTDNGNYKIKAHRFTKSCSYTEATNSADIVLLLPTPTPSPSPTPTPSPTPSPSPTSKPTATATPKPTVVSSPTNTPRASSSANKAVLGESDDVGSSTLPTLIPSIAPIVASETSDSNSSTILIIFVVIGGSLITAAIGYFAYDRYS